MATMSAAKDYARQKERWSQRKARIGALVAAGMSLAEVGRRYRISRARVHQIVNGRRK